MPCSRSGSMQPLDGRRVPRVRVPSEALAGVVNGWLANPHCRPSPPAKTGRAMTAALRISRCQRFGIRLAEERHRLEAVAAGGAAPQIGDAVRSAFEPFRRSDRLAALRARIFVR